MSAQNQKKRRTKHRTTVSLIGVWYVWRCSCGDHDSHVGMEYEIASAGARRHRQRMRELAREVATRA